MNVIRKKWNLDDHTHRFDPKMLQEDWEELSLESNLGRGLAAAAAHREVQQGRQRGVMIKRSPKKTPEELIEKFSKFK